MGFEDIAFLTENTFSQEIVRIEEALEALRHHGEFTTREGIRLFYEYFTPKTSRGGVVIVHGLSEFTKKYYELAWYLTAQGYSVFLYDQRGHGLSHRDTDRPELIHVQSFEGLAADLQDYLEAVVLPTEKGPLYLYAHSMGGAVGLLHLALYPEQFRKAVITSPLLQPTTNNLPPFLFRWGTGIHRALRGGKKKFLFSREYDPQRPYVHVPGDSESRVRHCLNHRNRDRRYQSTPMTVDCVYHSLGLKKRLLGDAVTKAIRTPILMLCAGKDTMVKIPPQEEFDRRCPQCHRIVLPDANHALLTCRDKILQQVLRLVLEHYEN